MRLGLAALIALCLSLPFSAEAGPGLGKSFGSRGSRSYSAPAAGGFAASPFQRSQSPAPGYNYGQNYGGGYGYRGGGFSNLLMGGLIGAGIGGLLFGHSFWGFHGGAGLLGLLIQLVLLAWLARWVFRALSGQPQFAGMGQFTRTLFPPLQTGRPGAAYGGAPQPSTQSFTLTQADYQAFSQTLQAIQAAWSRNDIATLQRLATPEMVGYFSEQLADLAQRGLRNEVREARLLKGDLAEAWQEGNTRYATVLLTFSSIDITLDIRGNIVDGSATEHITTREFWTFQRTPATPWLLSAIQQTR